MIKNCSYLIRLDLCSCSSKCVSACKKKKVSLLSTLYACVPASVSMCLCVCKGRAITLVYYLSSSKIGDVFLPGCWAGLRLKGLNRGGTKASEPEGGGEWMSWWDDNAAWHLWNESLVTMAKKRDGTVSQEPQIKPAVNDVWLVFRSCSRSAETFFQLFVHHYLCYCSVYTSLHESYNSNLYSILTLITKYDLKRLIVWLHPKM